MRRICVSFAQKAAIEANISRRKSFILAFYAFYDQRCFKKCKKLLNIVLLLTADEWHMKYLGKSIDMET